MSGYEGAGTDMNDGQGFGDGPGSGWGGSSKPGEDGIAQAGAKVGGMSNQQRADAGMGDMQGFNPNNPTQTVDQMVASDNVNKALSFGVPMAMSMAAPGFGLVNQLAKAGGRIATGTPVSDVALDFVPGIINSKINEATGGLMGKAMLASNLSGYLGGPQLPNVGRELGQAIAGKSSERSYAAGPAPQRSADVSSDGGGGILAQANRAATAPMAQVASVDVPYSTLGIDSPGWASASRKYTEAKNG